MADCAAHPVSENSVASCFTDSAHGLFWDTAYDSWGFKKNEQVDLS